MPEPQPHSVVPQNKSIMFPCRRRAMVSLFISLSDRTRRVVGTVFLPASPWNIIMLLFAQAEVEPQDHILMPAFLLLSPLGMSGPRRRPLAVTMWNQSRNCGCWRTFLRRTLVNRRLVSDGTDNSELQLFLQLLSVCWATNSLRNDNESANISHKIWQHFQSAESLINPQPASREGPTAELGPSVVHYIRNRATESA